MNDAIFFWVCNVWNSSSLEESLSKYNETTTPRVQESAVDIIHFGKELLPRHLIYA